MRDLPKLIASVVLCEGVGIIASFFTIPSIPTWYAHLTKPGFSPPDWLFGPVWILLYFLMGISLYLVWREGLHKKKVHIAVNYFLLQLGFNFFWSIIFFGMHQPFLALIDIAAMLYAIIMTMEHFKLVSKPAMYLLVPYLAWVTFATILNFSIVLLNI
ncbi:MAG: TspO/MBR family protein [Candidatus Levyibacteriota bacterium]